MVPSKEVKKLYPFLFALAFLCCLVLHVPSAAALFAGAALGLVWGNPWAEKSRQWTSPLLGVSIVALGAGMNLRVVASVGAHGILYTVVGISLTLALGNLLGRWLKTAPHVSVLLTVGTAICGGSAIAAVAPVIRAKHQDITLALATVFVLNALALLIFPGIGHFMGLSQIDFGLWSALAIHDTSSVVGSTLQYGREALAVGTTVKLARALWIVPVTLFFSFLYRGEGNSTNALALLRRSWFILGFLIAAAVFTWVPGLESLGHASAQLGTRLMVGVLFLIGSGLTVETLRKVGIKPFVQAVTLWVIVATGTLLCISRHWISL